MNPHDATELAAAFLQAGITICLVTICLYLYARYHRAYFVLWALAWFLLAAMGHRWPAANVVAGSAAASLSNLLPVNVIGNLGTLEAGWTAAFTALGVPVSVAAATGLASHIWALIFAAIFGAIAWLVITRSGPRGAS